MTRTPNAIPNGVRNLTIGAWVTLSNFRDPVGLGVLRFTQDEEFKND
jgi:hypothetical protein